MDAVLLASSLAVNWLSELVARKWRPVWFRTALSYAIGGIGVAAAMVLATERPDAGEAFETASERLPGIGAMASGSTTPGSRRVAPAGIGRACTELPSPFRPFEMRHEILVRLADVADLVGLGAGVEVLEVEAQAEVAERVGEFVVSRVALTVDGEPAPGTLDPRGLHDRGSHGRVASSNAGSRTGRRRHDRRDADPSDTRGAE